MRVISFLTDPPVGNGIPLAWTIHEDRSEGAQSPGWWALAGSECSEAYLRYVAGAEGRGRPPDGMNARPQ